MNLILLFRKERELAEMKRKAQHHLLEDDGQKKLQELEKESADVQKKVQDIQKEEKVYIIMPCVR